MELLRTWMLVGGESVDRVEGAQLLVAGDEIKVLEAEPMLDLLERVMRAHNSTEGDQPFLDIEAFLKAHGRSA